MAWDTPFLSCLINNTVYHNPAYKCISRLVENKNFLLHSNNLLDQVILDYFSCYYSVLPEVVINRRCQEKVVTLERGDRIEGRR